MRGEPIRPQPKPAKGSQSVRRIKDAIAGESAEDKAKETARRRDSRRCRWPHAHGEREICRRLRKEAAHLKGKGAGGANMAANLICLCLDVHQGPKSLHSGHRRVVPLTRDGANGPCAFEERATERAPWVEVGLEVSVGVLQGRI